MQLNPYIFRGYDIRGLAGTDLTEETMYLLGRGYATMLAERGITLCPVGRDSRKTSLNFAHSFIKGLNDGGVDTIDIGLSITQIVYFSSYLYLTRACAMVTASHNPKEFNGLKLGIGYSETLGGEDIQSLRQIILSGRFSTGYGTHKKADVFPSYLKNLLKHFRLQKKWRLVLDTLNSSSGKFYPYILRKAGCHVIHTNSRIDAGFPHGTDPTDRQVLERLSQKVIREKADLGLAFDADGDRMAVVDEKGHIHWMDTIVSLFATDILEKIPGATIIYNNLCSRAVTETIAHHGGKGIMWKTGHSYIKDKIKETKAMLGGELSGHIFFNDNYFGHDDAAYASLRLLSFLENHHETLSEAASSVETHLSSPEIKLFVPDDQKFPLVDNLLRHDFSVAFPDAKLNDLDGLRYDEKDRMVVIRPSQNGPYLTIRFEATDQKLYNELKFTVRRILEQYQVIDWSQNINGYALNT